MDKLHTWDFIDEFSTALKEQLEKDEKRWGETWLRRTREGQEDRLIKGFNDKFDRYLNAGMPLPTLQMAGDIFINWIREAHPEYWEK